MPEQISVRDIVSIEVPVRRYATHSWDSYPAKMVPHLARYAIGQVSTEGDTVLDPFCGCGTVQVESLMMSRHSIGFDINPVAVLFSKAKSSVYDTNALRKQVKKIVRSATLDVATLSSEEAPGWLDYWFTKTTLRKLVALRRCIDRMHSGDLKDVCRASLAVSVRKVSRADPRSPKPFISKSARRDRLGRHFDPFREFLTVANRLANASDDLYSRISAARKSKTAEGDARHIRKFIGKRKVDAIVTSPPYLTAQDYFRSSKLELAVLGYWTNQLPSELGQKIVGSGRGACSRTDIDPPPIPVPKIERLVAKNKKDGLTALTYITDMSSVVEECYKCLKVGGLACFVVGDCTMRGIKLPIHQWMLSMAENKGFRLVKHEVDIIRDRRLPPKRERHSSVIECEHLLTFRR